MKFPNKVINYNESVMSKFPIILSLVKQKEYNLFKLYDYTKKYFENIDEYVEVLDCLFALNKIILNEKTRSIRYVE